MSKRNGEEFEYRLMRYGDGTYAVHAYSPSDNRISKHPAAPLIRMQLGALSEEIVDYMAAFRRPVLNRDDFTVSDYKWINWD